jgi:hypothetical protein
MTIFGSVEFKIEELPSELRIRWVRHAGWIDWILAPAVPVLMMIGWSFQEPVFIAVGGGLFIPVICLWGLNHAKVLRVFSDRLIYSNYIREPKEILLADVEVIRWRTWSSWNESAPPDGLYISRGGRLECILGIGQKQARAVTNAISRKFPEFPVDLPVPGAAWFDELPDLSDFKAPANPDTAPDKND